jgi:hypothetical protein
MPLLITGYGVSGSLFFADSPEHSQNPWAALREIQKQLYAGEPIRPDLAHWLGEAIRLADGDTKALLRGLGLALPKGRPRKYPDDAWLKWGALVCEAIDDGIRPEKALDKVLTEMAEAGLEVPDRATLQRWAATYREAKKAEAEFWAEELKAEE